MCENNMTRYEYNTVMEYSNEKASDRTGPELFSTVATQIININNPALVPSLPCHR